MENVPAHSHSTPDHFDPVKGPSTRFLAEQDRLLYECRAQWSFCSEPYRDGYFRLFNKNALRTTFVRNLGPCPNRHGYYVELEGECDPYFKNILQQA